MEEKKLTLAEVRHISSSRKENETVKGVEKDSRGLVDCTLTKLSTSRR